MSYFKPCQMNGEAEPSISTKLLTSHMNQDGTIVDEKLIANVTSMIYAGLFSRYTYYGTKPDSFTENICHMNVHIHRRFANGIAPFSLTYNFTY